VRSTRHLTAASGTFPQSTEVVGEGSKVDLTISIITTCTQYTRMNLASAVQVHRYYYIYNMFPVTLTRERHTEVRSQVYDGK